MKILFIYMALAACLLVESCTNSRKTGAAKRLPGYASRKFTPLIDGKANEWGAQLSYDSNTKSIYAFANDSLNIYVMMKATDRIQQIKIIQGGMEIWIDPRLKKNKTIGIRYPIGGAAMQMPDGRGGNQPGINEMRAQLKQQLLKMELVGFRQGLNGVHNVYHGMQVKPVIDWDGQDHLIYELSIPLIALPMEARNGLADISIGVFIKGLKMPEGFSATGRPGGVGPAGGGSPAGVSQLENLVKENMFWTKYTLAE
jgi:hypothetical protein